LTKSGSKKGRGSQKHEYERSTIKAQKRLRNPDKKIPKKNPLEEYGD